MNRKHRKTLSAIFDDPARANIKWDDVVACQEACGATTVAGGGSMFSFSLNGITTVFHRPHPGSEIPKSMVRRLRRFAEDARIRP